MFTKGTTIGGGHDWQTFLIGVGRTLGVVDLFALVKHMCDGKVNHGSKVILNRL